MWWETHGDAEERSEGELCRLARDAPTEEEVAVRCPFAETDQREERSRIRPGRSPAWCQSKSDSSAANTIPGSQHFSH